MVYWPNKMMQTVGVNNMGGPIEIRKDGVVVCECANENCLYPYEIMKDMMKYGYKFYQNGKIYKPEKKKEKE